MSSESLPSVRTMVHTCTLTSHIVQGVRLPSLHFSPLKKLVDTFYMVMCARMETSLHCIESEDLDYSNTFTWCTMKKSTAVSWIYSWILSYILNEADLCTSACFFCCLMKTGIKEEYKTGHQILIARLTRTLLWWLNKWSSTSLPHCLYAFVCLLAYSGFWYLILFDWCTIATSNNLKQIPVTHWRLSSATKTISLFSKTILSDVPVVELWNFWHMALIMNRYRP